MFILYRNLKCYWNYFAAQLLHLIKILNYICLCHPLVSRTCRHLIHHVVKKSHEISAAHSCDISATVSAQVGGPGRHHQENPFNSSRDEGWRCGDIMWRHTGTWWLNVHIILVMKWNSAWPLGGVVTRVQLRNGHANRQRIVYVVLRCAIRWRVLMTR